MTDIPFGLVVPTLNPGKAWLSWLAAYARQSSLPLQAVIIDSGSSGHEIDSSQSYGFKVLRINKSDFNHGATRQLAANELSDVDVIVFLTQDAILASDHSLASLLRAFNDPSVAAAYGRQLPHHEAKPLGAHARAFNYGVDSATSSIESIPERGFKACFISNSFAAYRVDDLLTVGGFPSDVILGEDTCVAARLILAGKKVAYVADACVYHSHDYTVLEEFRRYFDTGVLHAQQPWLIQNFGGATGEGAKFVISELKYLAKHAPLLIPSALIRTFMKLLGYRLGRAYNRLPKNWCPRLSMHKGFWQDKH